MMFQSQHRRKAVALIMVLAVLGVLLSLVTPMLFQTTTEINGATYVQARVQAREVSLGLAELAKYKSLEKLYLAKLPEGSYLTQNNIRAEKEYIQDRTRDLLNIFQDEREATEKEEMISIHGADLGLCITSLDITDEQGKIDINYANPFVIGALFGCAALAEPLQPGDGVLYLDTNFDKDTQNQIFYSDGDPETIDGYLLLGKRWGELVAYRHIRQVVRNNQAMFEVSGLERGLLSAARGREDESQASRFSCMKGATFHGAGDATIVTDGRGLKIAFYKARDPRKIDLFKSIHELKNISNWDEFDWLALGGGAAWLQLEGMKPEQQEAQRAAFREKAGQAGVVRSDEFAEIRNLITVHAKHENESGTVDTLKIVKVSDKNKGMWVLYVTPLKDRQLYEGSTFKIYSTKRKEYIAYGVIALTYGDRIGVPSLEGTPLIEAVEDKDDVVLMEIDGYTKVNIFTAELQTLKAIVAANGYNPYMNKDGNNRHELLKMLEEAGRNTQEVMEKYGLTEEQLFAQQNAGSGIYEKTNTRQSSLFNPLWVQSKSGGVFGIRASCIVNSKSGAELARYTVNEIFSCATDKLIKFELDTYLDFKKNIEMNSPYSPLVEGSTCRYQSLSYGGDSRMRDRSRVQEYLGADTDGWIATKPIGLGGSTRQFFGRGPGWGRQQVVEENYLGAPLPHRFGATPGCSINQPGGISFWLRTGTNFTGPLFYTGVGADDQGIRVDAYGNKLVMSVRNRYTPITKQVAQKSFLYTFQANTWYHFKILWTGGHPDDLHMFIDGQPVEGDNERWERPVNIPIDSEIFYGAVLRQQLADNTDLYPKGFLDMGSQGLEYIPCTATQIPIGETTGWPERGIAYIPETGDTRTDVPRVPSEYFYYSRIDGNLLSGCVRGLDTSALYESGTLRGSDTGAAEIWSRNAQVFLSSLELELLTDTQALADGANTFEDLFHFRIGREWINYRDALPTSLFLPPRAQEFTDESGNSVQFFDGNTFLFLRKELSDKLGRAQLGTNIQPHENDAEIVPVFVPRFPVAGGRDYLMLGERFEQLAVTLDQHAYFNGAEQGTTKYSDFWPEPSASGLNDNYLARPKILATFTRNLAPGELSSGARLYNRLITRESCFPDLPTDTAANQARQNAFIGAGPTGARMNAHVARVQPMNMTGYYGGTVVVNNTDDVSWIQYVPKDIMWHSYPDNPYKLVTVNDPRARPQNEPTFLTCRPPTMPPLKRGAFATRGSRHFTYALFDLPKDVQHANNYTDPGWATVANSGWLTHPDSSKIVLATGTGVSWGTGPPQGRGGICLVRANLAPLGQTPRYYYEFIKYDRCNRMGTVELVDLKRGLFGTFPLNIPGMGVPNYEPAVVYFLRASPARLIHHRDQYKDLEYMSCFTSGHVPGGVLVEGTGQLNPVIEAIGEGIMAGPGYVRICNEVVGYNNLSYGNSDGFRTMRFAVPYDLENLGMYRGAFGTVATSHAQHELLFEQPFIYYDCYPYKASAKKSAPLVEEALEAQTFAMCQFSYSRKNTYFESITWDTNKLAHGKVYFLARVDRKHNWDEEPLYIDGKMRNRYRTDSEKDRPSGLMFFTKPGKIRMYGDRIEFRAYFDYTPGAFESHDYKLPITLNRVALKIREFESVHLHEEYEE